MEQQARKKICTPNSRPQQNHPSLGRVAPRFFHPSWDQKALTSPEELEQMLDRVSRWDGREQSARKEDELRLLLLTSETSWFTDPSDVFCPLSLICLSVTGVTYEVHVEGCNPYITIAVPDCLQHSILPQQAEQDVWANLRAMQMCGYFKEQARFSVEATKGRNVVGYENAYVNPEKWMVHVYSPSSQFLKSLTATLRELGRLNWPSQGLGTIDMDEDEEVGYRKGMKFFHVDNGLPVELFNTDLNSLDQILVKLKLRHMAWFSVRLEDCQGMRPTRRNSGDCMFDFHIPHEHIQPHMDDNLKENMTVAPLRVLSFDIEACADHNQFPKAHLHPVICISASLTTFSPAEGVKDPECNVSFSWGSVAQENPEPGHQILCFATEEEMFYAWSQFWRAYDPDVVTGWNINDFDIPYMEARIKALGIAYKNCALKWGRTSFLPSVRVRESKVLGRATKIPSIAGRLDYDMFQWALKNMQLRSYTLNSVALNLLKQTKEDMHYSFIYPMWTQSGPHGELQRRRLVQYCKKDAYLPILIMQKKMALFASTELARLSGVCITDLINQGQQKLTNTKLLHTLSGTTHFLPDKSTCITGPYEGGYVREPIRGWYVDYFLILLDYKSLYPTIMKAHNVSYDTLVMGGRPDGVEGVDFDESPYKGPNGEVYYFIKNTKVKSLLYRMVSDMLVARGAAKKLMEKEEDPNLRKVLDARQLSLKIAVNAMYGYTTFILSRMCFLPIGASVTAWGQYYIQLAAKFALENRPECEIIYGDTDSIMVKLRERFQTPEEALVAGRKLAEEFNRIIPKEMELECEGVQQRALFTDKKKKYVYVLHAPMNGKMEVKLTPKGIETVRRDGAPITGRLMIKMLEGLLLRGDYEGTLEYLRQEIKKIRRGEIKLHEFIVIQALNKEKYKTKNVVKSLYDRLHQKNPDEYPLGVTGVRLPYVIRKGLRDDTKSTLAAHPSDFVNEKMALNLDYYLDVMILPCLERILSVALEQMGSSWHEFLMSTKISPRDAPPAPKPSLEFLRRFGRCCAICCHTTVPQDREVCGSCLEEYGQGTVGGEKLSKDVEDLGKDLQQEIEACIQCASSETFQACRAYDCERWITRTVKMTDWKEKRARQQLIIKEEAKVQPRFPHHHPHNS
jgi:DNA polymerase elongation subunit (family B)